MAVNESEKSIQNQTMKQKIISLVLCLAYFALLVKVLVLKDLAMIRVGSIFLNFGGTHEGASNFIPFKTIYPYLLGDKGLIIAGINLIGNILLLVPLGFLLPMASKNQNWRTIILFAIASGGIIELLQVIFHVGIFDIDDVILNGLGFLIGYWIYLYFISHASVLKTKIVQYGALIILVGSFIFSSNYYIKNKELPIGFSPSISMPMLPIKNTNSSGANCSNCDLCGGTGGIGTIISVEGNTIDVKRKDGVVLHVLTTKETVIKKSEGVVNIDKLKKGERVTLVGDFGNQESMIATAVLVCAVPNN